MLDVHPPHAKAHTWSDFFVHIATICVGLLIAVGLEQSVEAIHRHHERAELRAALDAESRQILLDTRNGQTAASAFIKWHKEAEAQVSAAARDHHPLRELPSLQIGQADAPSDPVFTAAKASGKLALLDDDEIVVYGELDSILTRINEKFSDFYKAQRNVDNLTTDMSFAQPEGDSPYAHATPEDLKALHAVLVSRENSVRDLSGWIRQARGAATALIAGERDLRKVESAERQFDSPS